MLKIKPTQLDDFQKPITKAKRKIQLQSWRDQGLEVEEYPDKQVVTLIDKEEGSVILSATDFRVKTTSGERRTAEIKSNQQGQLQSIIDPAGFKLYFKYDEEKRLSKLKRSKHSQYQFEYDEFSHLRSIQYPDQSQLEFLYSPKGQLINSTNRNGQVTEYRYSKIGQLKQQIDPKGNVTRFEHHNTDAPSALVFPNGDCHKFRYDNDDSLKEITINGKQQAIFNRDQNKGTVEIQYASGGDVEFTLSGGNLVEANNAEGILKLEYDDQGRLLKEIFGQDIIEYKRNKLGALIALVLPDKTELSYVRDKDQRVIGVTDWKENLHSINYADNGALQQVQHPNGTQVKHQTNALGLIELLQIDSPFYPQRSIEHCQYSYDVCDRVINVQNNECQQQFSYDKEGRLTCVSSNDQNYNESFVLDVNGNCIQNQYGECHVNELDQLKSFAGYKLSYNNQGNTSKLPTPQGKTILQYNGRNQLISATTPQGKINYAYDPLGRRLRKQGSTKTTHYQWAGQQLLSEKTIAFDGSLISSCDYLYFPDSFHLMAMCQDDQIYYSHLGRRGEVLCMTDIKGEVVWQAGYSAFGIANISIEKIKQPWRLAGHYYDIETDLHYVLARYYSPQLGRFLSRDPLFVEGGSQNFYLYCNGDPLNRIDPTGEFIFTAIIIGAVVGAAIGAGIEAYRQSKAIERGEQQGYDGWGVAKAGVIGGVIGAVGGGVGAAVEGALLAGATATIATGTGIGAVGGIASSLVEQCAEVALKDRPLDLLTVAKQAAIDGIVGGGIGAVTVGTGGFLARRTRKGVQEGIDEVAKHTAIEASEKATKEASEKAAKELAEKTTKKTKEAIFPLAHEIKLAKTAGETSAHIAARKKVAKSYMENNGFTDDQIKAALGSNDGKIIGGIDLTKPVEIKSFPPPDSMTQHVKSHGYPGNWFDPLGTQTPDSLGISGEGRKLASFNIPEGNGLLSTSKPILDTWTNSNNPVQTSGGGQQIFINDEIKKKIISMNNIGS